MEEIPTIGRNALIDIIDHAAQVPAKIDTGADSSAIWASNIHIDTDRHLHFTLFDKGSPFYSGQDIVTGDFTVAQVRNSNGQIQIRYRTQITARIGGKRVKVLFNLSDRSQNDFPILIGRRTLSGKFIVDVTVREHQSVSSQPQKTLREELLKDPYEFHKKYHDTK